MKSILTNTEAELLIHFQQYLSIEALANKLNKDPTVISRQLKSISNKGNLIIKQSGRWKITTMGERYNQLTRDYIFAQKKITSSEIHLRIGTTKEFSAHILATNYGVLKKKLGVDSISFISVESSVEESLLNGEVDLAFDCGRPFSPDVLFKQCVDEPISVVIAKRDISAYKNIKSLENNPHILYERISPEKYIRNGFRLKNISPKTNDIATAKNLCINSEGWALLPNYTVKKELDSGELIIFQDLTFNQEKFGVYRLRHRKELQSIYEKAISWLENNIDL